MKKQEVSKTNFTVHEAAGVILKALHPLVAGDRRRAVLAALVMLGEDHMANSLLPRMSYQQILEADRQAGGRS